MTDERRVIGLYGCIALTLGNVIGSAIFTSPTEIIRETNSIGLTLCIFLFTGFLSITGGVTASEICSLIPISGGGATYFKFSGFRSIAFCFASSQIFLIFPTVLTLQSLTFSQYLVDACNFFVLDPVKNFYLYSGISIIVLMTLLFLNCFIKFKHLMKLNILMAAFKIGTLLAIVVMACISGKFENLSRPFENSTLVPDKIISSSYSAFYAFEGYDLICIGVEQVKNPQRNLPLAINISLVIVTIMYLLVNVSYALVLGTKSLIQFSAVDSLNRFAEICLGPKAHFVMPLLICICLLNTIQCTIFGASRIIHVSAREELLPGWLSCWAKNLGAPRAAFFFHILMVIIILLFLNLASISNINSLQDLTKWIQGVFVTVLLLFIRVSRISVNRNIFRANILFICLNLSCLVAFVCSTVFTKPAQIFMMIGVFGLALSIYLVLVRPTGLRRFSECENTFDSLGVVFTNAAQRLFLSKADRQPTKNQLFLERKVKR